VVTDERERGELPADVIESAERLTRLARRAVDEAEADAYREDRDARLAEYGFRARVREEDARDVLVCYPSEWMADGTVQLDRIEDRSRAVEVPLGGVGEEEEWESVEAHNDELVGLVRAAAGPVHAANARAFADFMGNHYVRRMESAGERELREFLTEYYPRNAWPSDEQQQVVEESLRLVFETAGRTPPTGIR
jgi:hypothetical protein